MENTKEHQTIKLKPILGILPKYYVSISLLLIILILIISPSLIYQGSNISIKTYPINAYVEIDGKIIGQTPLKKFIKKGSKNLKIKRYGFKDFESKINVPFSLIFRKTLKIDVNLELENPQLIISRRERELSNMEAIKIFNQNIKAIPVFSLSFNDLYNRENELLKNFLTSALPLINNEFLFEDFVKTNEKLYKSNFKDKEKLWHFLKETYILEEKALIWFYNNLKASEREHLLMQKWFLREIETLYRENKKTFELKEHYLNLNLDNFKKIENPIVESEESVSLNKEINFTLQERYKIKSFLISQNNVTKREFLSFLEQNPKWKIENREKLIDENLVDENYLKDFELLTLNDEVNYISYYTALAFAKWKTKSLPKGYNARLPYSLEWQAYINNSDEINDVGLIKNWNLMQESFAENSFYFFNIFKPYSLVENYDFVNIRTYKFKTNNKINHLTKASFNKSWTAPNIKFRLVIEKED